MTPLQTDKHISGPTNYQPLPVHQEIDEPSPIVRVGDLCSGMGGMALAARQLHMQVVVGVDSNEFSGSRGH